MRRFGVISLMFIGFVAGIIFVYSCGGGGSVVLAEITDVTGLEAGLDAINSSIQGIDASTDTAGLETALNSVASAIGGVTLSTDMSGVVSELQNIDASLQEIVIAMGSSPSTPLSIDYVTDGTLPPATGNWVMVSTGAGPINISGYSQARISVLPNTTSLHVGVKFAIGSVIGGSDDLGDTNEIRVVDLLGDTMEVEISNWNLPQDLYSIAVQLVP